MSFRSRIVLAGCSILVAQMLLPIAVALAQSSLWRSYVTAGREAAGAARHQDALELLTAAVAEAETFPAGDPRLAETLLARSRVLRSVDDVQGAESDLRRATEILADAGALLHLARARVELAAVLRVGGAPDEAEDLLKGAVGVLEREGERPEVAAALRQLAFLYRDGEKYLQAAVLYRRALTLDPGATPEIDAQRQLDLGQIQLAAGRTAEAEPVLEDALTGLEGVHGAEDPRLLPALEALAEARLARGDFDAAEPLLRRVLELHVAAGEPSAQAAAAFRLAELYREAGRPAEAEPFYGIAVGAVHKARGEGHPSLVPMFEAWSKVLWDLGRRGEAAKVKAKAKWIEVRQ